MVKPPASVQRRRQTIRRKQVAFSDLDIKAFDKYRLLNGLDDVQLTQEFGAQIDAFETGYKAENSWAY